MRSVRRRVRPSPSGVIAAIALVVALGGTSYAVVKLPAGSVGSQQLRNAAVTRAKIKNDAVDAAKIKAGAVLRAELAGDAVDSSKVAAEALTGADINEGSLTQVPSAASAGRAASAAGIDAILYRTAAASVPVAPTVGGIAVKRASAFCDSGQHVVGGGVKLDDLEATSVVDSFPDAGGTVWTADVDNQDDAAAHGFTVHAICVASAGTG